MPFLWPIILLRAKDFMVDRHLSQMMIRVQLKVYFLRVFFENYILHTYGLPREKEKYCLSILIFRNEIEKVSLG